MNNVDMSKASYWLHETLQDVAIKVLLFVFSPFLAFLYSLRRIQTKSSFVIFFLVSVFFGIAFTVPYGKYGWATSFDAQVYRLRFDEYQNITLSEFYESLLGFLSFDDGKKDFYFDTVAFLTSRFTDNYHYLFMIFAIVFSIFALKTLKFFVLNSYFKLSLIVMILLFLFMNNQIFNINGMRFWTAAWIAIYCVFKIYGTNNINYYYLAMFTPFIHGTFWFFLFILLIVQLTKRFEKIWLIFFVISFVASSFAIEFLEQAKSFLPQFISVTIDKYINDDILMDNSTQVAWVPVLSRSLIFIFFNFITFLFIKHSEEIKRIEPIRKLFPFILIWMSIINFMMFVPSLGARYMAVVFPVFAYIWLFVFNTDRYRWVMYLLPVIFFWNLYTQALYYSQVLSYDFYISSPLLMIYNYLLNTPH